MIGPSGGRPPSSARAGHGRGAGTGAQGPGGCRSPLTPAPVRVVFLGGVGEVGRNMACVELDGRILIIDVGLSFPSGDMPGIDLVLPDFDYIRRNADRVEAVVLTHGHEDHIGALPYLLREIGDLPVYGTPFTLELLRGKLEEHRVADRCELITAVPGGGRHGGAVLAAVPSGHALDPRRDGGGRRHAVRGDPSHRRLQDRSDPARRATDGPARPRRGGQRPGGSPAAFGLDQRRRGGIHLERAIRRPRAATTSSRALPRSWSPRASPATSTVCSRS